MESKLRISEFGNKFWELPNGDLHRTDGPATERVNGDEEWYLNGKLHREDGPAVDHVNGTKSWWLHGRRHREDGPAIKWANGVENWWLDGVQYRTEEEWKQALEVYNAKQITDLF